MTSTPKTPLMNPLFRLQYEKVQDGYVLLFPEGMIKLNPSASEILTLVDGVRTTDDIAVALRKAFPDAPEDLEDDVATFLQHAEEKKWVVYD
ncbi:coenzyme PQQ synthesis protein D [Alteromonas stellipolaris]|uniref:pyrroloquinoline quinone biosynthesis peptide chaperone PqqD n=1 Tax=Alteromonas stellipolaris TaxID=233316 RepID=UPI0007B43052|nr:pyrroloquinoline quinone biosynthesis peptide chaperone PqqD [Alteromonas stellipolaris]ANB24852.1 coenzyme PQQ synthesis protein D [Alteromonas stellipolaris]